MYPRLTTALLALLGGASCASPPLPVTDPSERWQPLPEAPAGIQRYCERVDIRDPAHVSWLTTAWQRVFLVSADCTCVGTCRSEAVLEVEIGGGSIASVACQPSAAPATHGIALDPHEAVRFAVVDAPEPEKDDYVVCFDYQVEREPFN